MMEDIQAQLTGADETNLLSFLCLFCFTFKEFC